MDPVYYRSSLKTTIFQEENNSKKIHLLSLSSIYLTTHRWWFCLYYQINFRNIQTSCCHISCYQNLDSTLPKSLYKRKYDIYISKSSCVCFSLESNVILSHFINKILFYYCISLLRCYFITCMYNDQICPVCKQC